MIKIIEHELFYLLRTWSSVCTYWNLRAEYYVIICVSTYKLNIHDFRDAPDVF